MSKQKKTSEEQKAIIDVKPTKLEEEEKDSVVKEEKPKSAKKKVLGALGGVKKAVGAKADDAVGAVKKAGAYASQKAEEASLGVQKQFLNPVFDDELRSSDMPDMIRICAPDKQHLDTLEMVAMINALNNEKDRLIEITVDGEIAVDEIHDFSAILDKLADMSNTIDSLTLWAKSRAIELEETD